jgi:hypothetical protein
LLSANNIVSRISDIDLPLNSDTLIPEGIPPTLLVISSSSTVGL